MKFVSVRSSFSKIYGFQYYFPENFWCNLSHYESINFFRFLSQSLILNLKILGFLFPTKNSLTRSVKSEILNFRKSCTWWWNGHLELFSLLQLTENSRQYLLLRTDILQKTVVGCPWSLHWRNVLQSCVIISSSISHKKPSRTQFDWVIRSENKRKMCLILWFLETFANERWNWLRKLTAPAWIKYFFTVQRSKPTITTTVPFSPTTKISLL